MKTAIDHHLESIKVIYNELWETIRTQALKLEEVSICLSKIRHEQTKTWFYLLEEFTKVLTESGAEFEDGATAVVKVVRELPTRWHGNLQEIPIQADLEKAYYKDKWLHFEYVLKRVDADGETGMEIGEALADSDQLGGIPS